MTVPPIKAEYEDRIVCFLDILGFRHLVALTTTGTPSEQTQHVQALADALLHLRREFDVDGPADAWGAQVTQFSDSLVLSFLATEAGAVWFALEQILLVQASLVYRGILVRGGVTRGHACHTRELLFGPAVTSAYDLERTVASVPRIVVDTSVILAAADMPVPHHDATEELEWLAGQLLKDTDGRLYIDYIGGPAESFEEPAYEYPRYLNKLDALVAQGLQIPDLAVQQKFQWLKAKSDAARA